MPTNQEARQASIRAVTGTAYFYNDDWMALFRLAGITSGTYDDRMLVWLNMQLGTSYRNINDAMRAYAVSMGATSWDVLGDFPAGVPGFVYLIDSSGNYLVDSNGAYLIGAA